MNALTTPRRNRKRRAQARARAAFWRDANELIGIAALAVTGIPAVAAVAAVVGHYLANCA